jgi:hypothetical protein
VDAERFEDALVGGYRRFLVIVHICVGGGCSSSAGREAVAPDGPVGGHVVCVPVVYWVVVFIFYFIFYE